MKARNNLLKTLFYDTNRMYLIEAIIIFAGSIVIYEGYRNISPFIYHLDYPYSNLKLSFFNNYIFSSSKWILSMYNLFIIIIAAYEIFIFSRIVENNRFITIYSLGFSKKEIMASYYIIFILYPLLLLSISYVIITLIEYLSFQYYLLIYLILFTALNLMLFISIGFIISIITKNSFLSGLFIILLFYIIMPMMFQKPKNTVMYHLFNSVYGYTNFGINNYTYYGLLIEFLLSVAIFIISIAITYYRDMKVVR